MISARELGISIKYPKILLYFIFNVFIPVLDTYSDCNAAIVSLAPLAKRRILSSDASKPSRITLPSRKNVGNSSANALRNFSANSSCVFIDAKRAANPESKRDDIIWAWGRADKNSKILRISRGVPRPDNKRDKQRPTSGTVDNMRCNPIITSGFSIMWEMWAWRFFISSISDDNARRYERNLRAPAAVLVLSRTSIRHVPPSLIGASISRLFHVAESINNCAPDLN